jgi:hypothetical protein
VFAGVPYRNLRRILPPAIGELLTIALARAVDDALTEAAARTVGFTPGERDLAQRRAVLLGAQLVIVACADAWQVANRSRDQRESSTIRALRPWLP